ncbi:uncharacterized protein LOC125009108 isoform X4 [Mugil cephalus]|uniref:uncharacterized protein LOC125009108 isoform X4 n=1 Tax=Mugil cephalus TaxID=48193 RepID=UPI001FB7AB4F|nr:uncharacterized protein LOC125009108 isoform X4 [Mugil cephalus]
MKPSVGLIVLLLSHVVSTAPVDRDGTLNQEEDSGVRQIVLDIGIFSGIIIVIVIAFALIGMADNQEYLDSDSAYHPVSVDTDSAYHPDNVDNCCEYCPANVDNCCECFGFADAPSSSISASSTCSCFPTLNKRKQLCGSEGQLDRLHPWIHLHLED